MDGFTNLATGGCPPIADLMLALAAEFRDVDTDAADQRLDQLALPLFGLAGGDLRLLDTDPGFDADRSSVAGLWFDAALEVHAGHPLMLAAVVAEAGPRAGRRCTASAPTAGTGPRRRRAPVARRRDDGPTTADPWSRADTAPTSSPSPHSSGSRSASNAPATAAARPKPPSCGPASR